MKPVNLLPGTAPVVAAEPTKPNLGMIGGAAVGLLAVVGVAAYFAMARVDSVKSETEAANSRATAATQDTTSVRSQIDSLGQPVVDNDKQLAQGAEQVLVSAYTERYDFGLLAQELRGIMDPAGWYVIVKASTSPEGEGKAVTITGYMPTKELAASFNERANATSTLSGAVTIALQSEKLINDKSHKPGTYWKFTTTADLVDTVAPSADGGGGSSSDSTGTTVGSGGGDGGALVLSLDSEPPKPAVPAKAAKPAAPVVPPKPKNPFDIAAATAGQGGAL